MQANPTLAILFAEEDVLQGGIYHFVNQPQKPNLATSKQKLNVEPAIKDLRSAHKKLSANASCAYLCKISFSA